MSYTIQYFFSVQRRIAISITSWHFDTNIGLNESLSNTNFTASTTTSQCVDFVPRQ